MHGEPRLVYAFGRKPRRITVIEPNYHHACISGHRIASGVLTDTRNFRPLGPVQYIRTGRKFEIIRDFVALQVDIRGDSMSEGPARTKICKIDIPGRCPDP